MASVQARRTLRRSHPLLLLTRLVSLIVFLFMLAAGWVALSYLKHDLSTRSAAKDRLDQAPPASPHLTAPTAIDEAALADVARLSAPVHLVYSCKSDKEHYHTSAHLPGRCEATALSEQSALQRGLKPCKICMPE